MPADRVLPSTALCAALALAPGCSPGTTSTACSNSVMAEAMSQVATAVTGTADCKTNDDCLLVPLPCSLKNPCGFAFWAVNQTGEAAVEHAFSVANAETCVGCVPGNPDLISGACSLPTAADLTFAPRPECDAGICTVGGVPPDGG